METYRWDKRREKKLKRKRFASITVFDAILLFLIFCLGLFFFYAFLSMSFRTSYCFEQIANYGTTEITPSVFKALYFISLILFALWGTLLVLNLKSRPNWLRFIWDTIIGCSIIIMCGLYFHLSVWGHPNPPDGTLGIGEGVWTTENGTPEWRKLPPLQIPLDWTGGTVEYFSDYHRQECVWLDRNEIGITLGRAATVDNFEVYLHQIQNGGLKESFDNYRWPDEIKLSEYIAAFLHPTSHIEWLRDTQLTRPLSPEEKQRFLDKRACIKRQYDPSNPKIRPRFQIEEACDPSEVPYWPPGYW